jgi:hypothetical protein
MSHVVLLGDSILDNASYVPGEPAVIEQVRDCLPRGWRATLLAVDGAVARDVAGQLTRLPEDASHLVVSVGGNDALEHSGVFYDPARSVGEAILQLAAVRAQFQEAYRGMLAAVLAHQRPTVVCTIYDRCPFLDPDSQALAATGLAVFNDVITREAVSRRVPILDLRVLCDELADYSSVSPIEPSAVGGAKIAEAICRIVTQHESARPQTAVYGKGP